MSSLDADVEIILHAEDRASSEVTNAVKRMSASWRDHQTQTRAVTRSYEMQNKTMFATARALQSVGNVVNRAISIYNSFTLTQIRLQDAARNSTEATINYNEAVARSGEGSPEAIKAADARTQALKAEKEATDQATIGYAFMVISIIADTTRLMTSVVPRLKGLIALTRGAGAAAFVPGAASAVGGLGAAARGAGAAGLGVAAATVGVAAGVGIAGHIGATAISEGLGIKPHRNAKGETMFESGVNQIFNFFGTTTDDLLKKIQDATKGLSTFGQ